MLYTGSSPHSSGEPSKDTVSVTFFSISYLELGRMEPKAAIDSTQARKSLVGVSRELNQVVQKGHGIQRREVLHV